MRSLLLAAMWAGVAMTAAAQAPRAEPPPPPVLGAEPATAHPAEASASAAHATNALPLPAAASDASSTEPRLRGEPAVRYIVVEDDNARIEELRVRSVPQKIVVKSKAGRASNTYEIITGDGSRDLSYGANTSRGAAGQRVWRVLDF